MDVRRVFTLSHQLDGLGKKMRLQSLSVSGWRFKEKRSSLLCEGPQGRGSPGLWRRRDYGIHYKVEHPGRVWKQGRGRDRYLGVGEVEEGRKWKCT